MLYFEINIVGTFFTWRNMLHKIKASNNFISGRQRKKKKNSFRRYIFHFGYRKCLRLFTLIHVENFGSEKIFNYTETERNKKNCSCIKELQLLGIPKLYAWTIIWLHYYIGWIWPFALVYLHF